MKLPKYALWGLIGLVLIIIAGIVVFSLPKDQQEKSELKQFSTPEAGATLWYDLQLSNLSLSEQDKKDKLVLRLANKKGQDKELLVTLRYEDGLKVLTTLTKQEIRDAVLGNIAKSYPARFTEYTKISERKFEHQGKQAAELIFTYKGPNGELVKQRFLLVERNNEMAVYLSAQSRESDFSKLNKQYFDPIFTSLHVK